MLETILIHKGFSILPRPFGRYAHSLNGVRHKVLFHVVREEGNPFGAHSFFVSPDRAVAAIDDVIEGQGEPVCDIVIPPPELALRETLNELGWSQRRLAAKLGLDPNSVSRWLTGKVPVPPWVVEYCEAMLAIRTLARKFGVV